MCIEIGVQRKNSFFVWSAPSASDGRVPLTKGELIEKANRERHFCPMDYGDPEGDFGGVLTASVVTGDEFDRAMSVHDVFKVGYPFPANYLEGLTAARARMHEIANARLRPSIVEQDLEWTGGVICKESTNS